ncbi:MAG: DinB family protein [Bacteroidota bacterium]
MRNILERHLQQLNLQLNELLKDLANYTSAQLNRVPAPGSWSALQVLNHLQLSEQFSRQYCEKKLSFKPKLPKAGLTASVRSKIVTTYLQSPLKAKAPKFIAGSALPATDELDNVAQKYQHQRQKLARFLATVDEEYLDKQVYKHPLGGRLSIEGMLLFFNAHFQHHRKQIYRALA